MATAKSKRDMTLKVAALTPGRHVPSARFRVRQHIASLRERGIQVEEYVPAIDKYARLPGWPRNLRQSYAAPLFVPWQAAKLAARFPGIVGSWRRRVTWLQRALLPGVPSLEGLLKAPLVFDVDDAIWLKRPFGAATARRIARQAAVVVAGNRYLADWFSVYCDDVRVVPTAIDTDRFHPASTEVSVLMLRRPARSALFPYLRMIEKPLLDFLRDHANARLLVVADRPPEGALGETEQMRFTPWSEGTEAAAVQAMDVGLMPLPDNAWTRGKCSFKMLQYMACGIPAIVSPVGMNAEVLALGQLGLAAVRGADWYEALEHFYRDRDKARAAGREGRSVARRHFSRAVVSRRLAEVFQQVSSGSAEPDS